MRRLTINLCTCDRVLRFFVGLICMYLGFSFTALIPNRVVAVVVGLFGALNFFASATAHCPVYAACGISSLRKKAQKSGDEPAV